MNLVLHITPQLIRTRQIIATSNGIPLRTPQLARSMRPLGSLGDFCDAVHHWHQSKEAVEGEEGVRCSWRSSAYSIPHISWRHSRQACTLSHVEAYTLRRVQYILQVQKKRAIATNVRGICVLYLQGLYMSASMQIMFRIHRMADMGKHKHES